MVVKLTYDVDQFANGLPNISTVIRGKKVLNPANNATAWSQNPALCVYDYLRDTKYGLGESASNILTSSVTAAATICDQTVSLAAGGTQARYTIDGVVDTAGSMKSNIDAMLGSMIGRLVFSSGQFEIYAGAYVSPTYLVDESVAVGDISIQTKQSRRSAYNGVKGVFLSEDDNYILADYPAQLSSTFAAQDGDPIYLDMALPFTVNNIRAQRIAKLALFRSRQQEAITIPCNLSALRFKIGDNINVSNVRLGYSNKVFEVVGYNLDFSSGQIVVNVDAIETAASIWNWATSDEEVFLGGGEVALYNGMTAAAPTSLSVTGDSFLSSDGTFNAEFNVAWANADDAFTDHYVVEWKLASVSNYYSMTTKSTPAVITTLQNGQNYNIRVKAVNEIGVSSAYVSATPTAATDTTAPNVPSSVSATGQFEAISVNWTNPTASDFSHVDVYQSTSSGGTYALVGKSSGTSFVKAGLSTTTTYYYKVKAVDFTGNQSAFSGVVNATTTTAPAATIPDGSISTVKIADDAITNRLIATDAVNSDSIAANSVTAVEIVAGTITATEIAANTITANKIAANTITASQVAANTLTAAQIQASSITVDKLSGDVSELYPTSFYANHTITTSTTFVQQFHLPAPSLGIVKRQRLDFDFDFTFANAGGANLKFDLEFIMQVKSKSATGTAVSTVTLSGGAPAYNQWMYMTGNQLAKLDNNGGVANNSAGSGTTGTINSVFFEASLNRTYVMVSSASAAFSTGNTMYFSPSKFLSVGTYFSPENTQAVQIYIPPSVTVTHRLSFSETFGESSTVTEFRPSMRETSSIANVTAKLQKWSGTMENVS
jgi:predicted phage tail protein